MISLEPSGVRAGWAKYLMNLFCEDLIFTLSQKILDFTPIGTYQFNIYLPETI